MMYIHVKVLVNQNLIRFGSNTITFFWHTVCVVCVCQLYFWLNLLDKPVNRAKSIANKVKFHLPKNTKFKQEAVREEHAMMSLTAIKAPMLQEDLRVKG